MISLIKPRVPIPPSYHCGRAADPNRRQAVAPPTFCESRFRLSVAGLHWRCGLPVSVIALIRDLRIDCSRLAMTPFWFPPGGVLLSRHSDV
jgi:hypothetical protein